MTSGVAGDCASSPAADLPSATLNLRASETAESSERCHVATRLTKHMFVVYCTVHNLVFFQNEILS